MTTTSYQQASSSSWFRQPPQDLGGIRRVELPVSSQRGSVNIYLVPQQDGWILVDCGMNLPNVLPAYEAAGIDWSTIRQIVLTHTHPDHAGFAERIRQLTGAPVRMHRRENELLKKLRAAEQWLSWQDEVLQWARVPHSARGCIRDAFQEMQPFFPTLAADSYIEHGEIIPTALGPMKALLTPGHSQGHLCFYVAEKKLLLAGDQLLRPRTPHLEWYAEGNALADFRASLRQLQILSVDWVLPSHGRAFAESEGRIASLLDCSRDMGNRIASLRARGNESAHQLALAYWKRPMTPFEHRNAVFEMLAYIQ